MVRPERLLDEGRQLVMEAEQQGLVVRLLGGVAIRLLLGPRFDPTFERPLRDIDLIVRRRDARKLEALIAGHGWNPARQFNALNGARRLLFHDPGGDAQIDVFVESFEMCHVLPLAESLGEPGPSLPATDLLMTKLQIVELNEKDRDDCYALLRGSAIGAADPAAIDPARIARLTGGDWGLHHTFELNLARLTAGLQVRRLPDEAAQSIRGAVGAVAAAMEAEPKSRGWRLRARIGERKRWYEEPEEVKR
jgi:Uncharacterised nucleotidyltransferase